MRRIKTIAGVELPIIQAPMAGVQGSALTIAVSNAGGLGSLPCAMLSQELLRSELDSIVRHTDKPFNLNFFAHQPPEPDALAMDRWQKHLSPYYDEFGLDAHAVASGPSREPFSEVIADLIEEVCPPVISFHFGLPSPQLVKRIKKWGTMILSTATTVDEALWLEANGADAIIAQGLEAGGHRGSFLAPDLNGQMGTFELLPQIVDAVRLPVIAAGGIADAKGVQAALKLGAVAAQVGTAYLLCPEASTSPLHREAIKAPYRPTVLTNLFSGGVARGVVNRVIEELGPISDFAPAFPLASTAMTPLRTAAESLGSDGFSPLWSGKDRSGCVELPAAELTCQLAGVKDYLA